MSIICKNISPCMRRLRSGSRGITDVEKFFESLNNPLNVRKTSIKKSKSVRKKSEVKKPKISKPATPTFIENYNLNEKEEGVCVMFDIESTGLGTKTAEIIQIAALPVIVGHNVVGKVEEEDKFNRFVVPRVSIQRGATGVHGMEVVAGRLIRRGQDLKAGHDPGQMLEDFFLWCNRLVDRSGQVVLVAHNGTRFDFPLLFSQSQRYGVSLSPSLRSLKVVDSLSVCNPYRQEFGNCKLETLKRCLVKGGGSQSHDALDDCADLREVLSSLAGRNGESTWEMVNNSGAMTTIEKYNPSWKLT